MEWENNKAVTDIDESAPVRSKEQPKGNDPNAAVRQAVSFNMRKRIGSTAYEVEVHFSPGSGETMNDKILRLVRGGALNGRSGEK
jgi:hypothetical protein